MTRLWLKFRDENGTENRVEIDRSRFTIGRHSACDLTITDSRLSREHLSIERDGDRFIAADLGSSNGTTLDRQKLSSPAELADRHILDLGGGIELTVEILADELSANGGPLNGPAGTGPNSPFDAEIAPLPAQPPATAAAGSTDGGGIPTSFFFIAPLLALFVLATVVGVIVLFGSDKKAVQNSDDSEYASAEDETSTSEDGDKDPIIEPVKSTRPAAEMTPAIGTSSDSSTPPPTDIENPANAQLTEAGKVQQTGAAFIRQMAQNDPSAFLTTDQADQVSAKIKQFRGSSAIGDNINSAKRSAAQIVEVAKQKNLKPQFLAIAAITKLGNSRGDVVQSARAVAEIYDKLSVQLGGSTFDDALLMVAAYEQGVAGETMKMRDLVVNLAGKENAPNSREVRTVWYLKKQGKLSAPDYERVLDFLAIGTIAQNPKEFGVNAMALTL